MAHVFASFHEELYESRCHFAFVKQLAGLPTTDRAPPFTRQEVDRAIKQSKNRPLCRQPRSS
eukprot:5258498-Pyramimonas_sp.AAC.1